MHRYGEGDHPSQQIDVAALRERLHLERLQALATTRHTVPRGAGRTPRRRKAPSRLSLRPGAYRHLAAVAVLLVLAMLGVSVAAAADAWRSERDTQGWIRACTSCHGRVIDQPSP